MADYWVSQPRKQCEFCKCWIADNKPSIAFHESGKKHKENVAKRLSEISKKSAKDAKNQVQIDKEMKKMEEAALKAYMKDVEENADFTSQIVLEGLEQKQKEAENAAAQRAEDKMAKEAAKQREKIELDGKKKRVKEKAAKIKWFEARSDEGFSYYWHTETNETKWDVPAEGYLTLAEQKVLEEADKEKPDRSEFKKKNKQRPLPAGHKRKPLQNPSSTFVKRRAQDLKPSETSKKIAKPSEIITVLGPAPKPNPYGLWKAVETRVEDPVDLQLPSQSRLDSRVPTLSDDQPKIKFHEKKITRPILDDESSSISTSFIGFKKKSCFRGNVRQRLDTDD